jgi:hypothetical protein
MNRKSEGLHRQFRTQSNVPRNIPGSSGLIALTGDYFLNQILIDTGLGNGTLQGENTQLDWLKTGKRPHIIADCRPGTAHNYYFSHKYSYLLTHYFVLELLLV